MRQYLEEKRPDLAIPELQALVALDSDNADAHGNLGVLLFFKGDCAHAVPELRAAAAQISNPWRLRLLLGTCERRTGDVAAALSDLDSAFQHLEDTKMRLDAGMELIDLYLGSGKPEKAAPIVDELARQNPADVKVLYAAYRIHADLEGQAMLSLSMVDPDSAEMHDVMGREALRYGDPTAAVAQFRAAIKINPKLPGIHTQLADVLDASLNPADKKEAESEYRSALELEPGDEKAQLRLGEMEMDRGNLQQAEAHFANAMKVAPTDADAALGMAKMKLAMKQNDQAQRLLEQAVALEPDDYEAHYLLGRLYKQEGRDGDSQKEIDLFKKYKAMKDKLQEITKRLRFAPPIPSPEAGGGPEKK